MAKKINTSTSICWRNSNIQLPRVLSFHLLCLQLRMRTRSGLPTCAYARLHILQASCRVFGISNCVQLLTFCLQLEVYLYYKMCPFKAHFDLNSVIDHLHPRNQYFMVHFLLVWKQKNDIISIEVKSVQYF
jgi:hypothetical protein